eukprot:3064418-Amphidinium_carterae.1
MFWGTLGEVAVVHFWVLMGGLGAMPCRPCSCVKNCLGPTLSSLAALSPSAIPTEPKQCHHVNFL